MNSSHESEFHVAKAVLNWLAEIGFESRLAGGCVRDMKLGIKPKDFDIASRAAPDDLLNLSNHQYPNWLKSIIPTGVDHGTVTLLHKNGMTFEITALRQDVQSDGRHAKVRFGVSFEEDAWRRDFTVNALFMDQDRNVYDFVDGLDDLKRKCLRFVGSPKKRIAEDQLRALRFFRFLSQLGFRGEKDSQAASLGALKNLKRVSRERIQSEWVKLLKGPYCLRTLPLLFSKGNIKHLFRECRALRPKDSKKFLSCLKKCAPENREACWYSLLLFTKRPSSAIILRMSKNYKLSNRVAAVLQLIFDLSKLDPSLSALDYLEWSWTKTQRVKPEIWREAFSIFDALVRSKALSSKRIYNLEMKLSGLRSKQFPFDGASISRELGVTGKDIAHHLRLKRREFWGKFRTHIK